MIKLIMRGIIDRRILVNYIAEPEVVKKIIPSPFTPKIYNGKAIVGICLIRLKQIRPKGFPGFLGVSSENGAHRFAVEWTEQNETKEGVYIPRRDTSSVLNTLAGGRIFPVKSFRANFDVYEKDDRYQVAFKSIDGTCISIDGKLCDKLDESSIFENIDNASAFFKNGATGYSPNAEKFDGVKLETFNWKVQPLHLTKAQSSYFENEALFPKGTVQFDHALLMTKLKHEWVAVPQKS